MVRGATQAALSAAELLGKNTPARNKVMTIATRLRISFALALLLMLLRTMDAPLAFQEKREAVDSSEERVSFRTEDGWTISGTLTKPSTLAEGKSVAAVLFVHSSSHDQDLFSKHGYPAFGRMQNQFVTLSIDIRGRGKSEGPLELHSFTPQQRENLYNRPMLLVTGDGMGDLTKKFAQLIANDKRNRVITHPGAIAAYLLFEVDRELEPTIAQWFKEQLSNGR